MRAIPAPHRAPHRAPAPPPATPHCPAPLFCHLHRPCPHACAPNIPLLPPRHHPQWYLSSAGYGVLRNTWAPGAYSFTSPVVSTHNESTRFDAFFLLAGPGQGSVKTLLGLYTQLTGPPFLPPLYALFLGDSDCYHNDRHGNSTQVAIAVAKLYNSYDMPHGWALPNDGYGCGYGEGPAVFPSNLTDLTYVMSQLHEQGMYAGLWTSTGMPNINAEVGIAGSRVCKTDVGWIGSGYKYAFDGVTLCANGIEEYSTPPARRFVWTVEGWAGTHRLAVMWTGDNSGSMDYVRWQVPSFVGAGFSAMAHVSGDVDGIFGGSPESQVRDFQAKALTTTIMTMSGWAANPDKQPWTWGEPYTTYNRATLKLKARLTPYIYSNCREAYDTGVPPVRAPLMEFPTDEALYTPTNATSSVYMSGPSLLVAPVYVLGAVTRDGIYLPAGTWVEWWNGTRYTGGVTVDGYSAPLSTLPLFVRAGAIIPMWPAMNYFNAAPPDPMFLELFPSGVTSFTLYEDDGVTRDALPPTSAHGRTAITVAAPPNYLNSTSSAAGNVTVTVAAVQGSFTGQLTSRGWWFNIRSLAPPLQVVLNTTVLPQMQSEAELEYASAGWFHDPVLQQGLLMVKLSSMVGAQGFSLTLSNGPSYSHLGTEACDTPGHHEVEDQLFSFSPLTGKINVLGQESNATTPYCVTVGQDRDPDSHTPSVEVQLCTPALDSQQQFVLLPGSNQLSLKADGTTCVDQDVSVNRVITYGCHDAGSPGNQAWALNPGGTQHILSLQNGLCMCVLPQA